MPTAKQHFWSSIRVYSWLALVVVAIFLPGHWGHALHEARFGQSFWSVLTTSIASDIQFGSWMFGAAVILPLMLPHSRFRTTATLLTTSATAFGLWVFTIAAMEFRIHRGLQMTFYDLMTAKGDGNFLLSTIPTVWQGRYSGANLVAGLLTAIGLLLFGRALSRHTARFSGRRIQALAAVATTLVLTIAGFQYYVHAKYILPGMVDRSDYRSSLFLFLNDARPWGALTRGFRTTMESTEAPWEEIQTGAAMLGWDGLSASPPIKQTPRCAPHPFATRFGVANDPKPTDASPLEQSLTDLSGSLALANHKPFLIWQVMVESVRADEIHAINPLADARVTPWINQLLTHAERPDQDLALWTSRNWGSGARSSQALAGIVCGVGLYPFTFSAARDLGNLPLRCIQDVLKDSGFTTRVYFGSSLTFDEKREFYRWHGQEAREGADAPKDSIAGSWGITDLSLMKWAVDEVASDFKKNPRSMHVLVTTISNHPPFELPPDAPPDLVKRLKTMANERHIDSDEAKRMTTVAYTDYALQALVERIRAAGLADRSVFFLTMDHATGEPPRWEEVNSIDHPAARRAAFRIPIALMFPREFVATSTDPQSFAAHLSAANGQLRSMDISQNDTPRLLLDVLARSGALDSLPPAWRWHTLGGQRLSRNARFAPYPEAKVWGMDAQARLGLLDSKGGFLPVAIQSWPPPPGTSDLRSAAGVFGPIVSVTGYLLRNGMDCPIRMKD